MGDFWNKTKVFLGFEPEEETTEKRRINMSNPGRNNLIKLNSMKGTKQSEVIVTEPRVYEDTLAIANYLRENKPVIVNLKYIDNDNGKRLIDFVCGTAYAIDGHMLKIGENIFLFTPEKVAILEGEEQVDPISDTEKIKDEPVIKTNIA